MIWEGTKHFRKTRNYTDYEMQWIGDFNPNSAIEKKEYFSILISNCVAVEKNKR